MRPFIFTIVLPLLIGNIIIINEDKNIDINCQLIGPYEENSGEKLIDVQVTNKNTLFSCVGNLILKISNAKLTEFTYYRQNGVSIPKLSTKTLAVPFPTDYFYEHEMSVELAFQTGIDKQSTCKFVVVSISPKHFDISKLPSQKYNNDKSFVRIKNNKAIYFKEEFDFQFFSKRLNVKDYYRLPLDDYYFTYDSLGSFIYNEAYISFEDPLNVFPLIDSFDQLNGKRIELELSMNIPDVYFYFKKSLYVEPNYLLMSNSLKEGLIKTNHFYFPVYRLKELNGMQFRITINGLGHTRNSFSFTFSYYSDKYLVGNCSNATYCVVGGVYS